MCMHVYRWRGIIAQQWYNTVDRAFDNARVWDNCACERRIVIEKSYDLFSEGNEVRGRLLYNRRARCAVTTGTIC